jgi:hypothetical protein
MSAITLTQTPEYDIRGEFLGFGVILHSEVSVPWSKDVRTRFLHDLQGVISHIGKPCFAFQTESHDPKKRKFIQSVGGIFDHYRITGDGENAEIFRFPSLGLV